MATDPHAFAKMRIPGVIARLFAWKGSAASEDNAQKQLPGKAPIPKTRRRLFAKYVALFVAVVCVALISNGVFDVFFYYQEHKTSLIRIQREQVEAAAAKISQFVKEIDMKLAGQRNCRGQRARLNSADLMHCGCYAKCQP